MILAGLGQAEGYDTKDVIANVIHQCDQQMCGVPPKAGIVFAGVHFDHQQMLSAICQRFPGIELIGCTTGGEFSSSLGFSDDSICLLTLHSEAVEFKTGLGIGLNTTPQDAVSDSIRQAREGLSGSPVLCLALPDGYNKSFIPILNQLNHELGADCQVFGGCAGSQWLETEKTDTLLQFHKDRVVEDAVPIMLMAGPLEYTFSVANSWKPIGSKAQIGEAQGRNVKRIGNFSAVEFYRHYLGDHDEVAREFVLAVFEPGEKHFYLRAPILYHDDGSITFSEEVPSGSTAQLTEAVREDLIQDTRSSTRFLAEQISAQSPAFALAFSCAFRKEILGTRTSEELHILQQMLPVHTPVMGFYTFGEIAPMQKGHASYFHGATLVTLLVSPGQGLETAMAESKSRSVIMQADYQPKQLSDVEQLQREVALIERKLKRSENYRKRMEDVKDFNANLQRKIIAEIEAARREIQQKEAALRRSEEKYRRIVETAGEGFILMDEDLLITDVNDAYCQMIGFSKDELLGKCHLDLATSEHRDFLIASRDDLLSQEYRKFECEIVAKDGRHIPILVHGNNLRDSQGNIIGNMAFVTDMTTHKKALTLAGEVQKNLLPSNPPLVPGLDIAGRSLACDEIGGDYFDYLWGLEGTHGPLNVVVGDITGHGVDAALLMTAARAFLRMRASQPGSLSQIIDAMNRHLARDVLDTGHFMTLFCMAINAQDSRLEWVRAGHDPALLYDPKLDRFDELKGSGVALGLDENYAYRENHKSGLTEGQVIAIGTDGIWEAPNKNGHMFGKERLRNIIRHKSTAGAENILNTVYKEVLEHTGGLRPDDDVTLVVIKFAGNGSGRHM